MLRIIVVRAGQFNDYKRHWGHESFVLQLPPAISHGGLTVTAEQGQVGFARRFCQAVAHGFGLQWVWMVDDNVTFIKALRLVDAVDGKAVQLETCAMDTAMRELEGTVGDIKAETLPFSESDLVHSLAPAFSYATQDGVPLLHESGDGVDQPAKTRAEFAGRPSHQCAVIALSRRWLNYKDVISGRRKPFTFTPRSYSFFLLNVGLTVSKRVFYPMRSHWEDVDFNEACERKGLAVIKCNTIFHAKENVQRTMPNLRPTDSVTIRAILVRDVGDAEIGDYEITIAKSPSTALICDLRAEIKKKKYEIKKMLHSSDPTEELNFQLASRQRFRRGADTTWEFVEDEVDCDRNESISHGDDDGIPFADIFAKEHDFCFLRDVDSLGELGCDKEGKLTVHVYIAPIRTLTVKLIGWNGVYHEINTAASSASQEVLKHESPSTFSDYPIYVWWTPPSPSADSPLTFIATAAVAKSQEREFFAAGLYRSDTKLCESWHNDMMISSNVDEAQLPAQLDEAQYELLKTFVKMPILGDLADVICFEGADEGSHIMATAFKGTAVKYVPLSAEDWSERLKPVTDKSPKRNTLFVCMMGSDEGYKDHEHLTTVFVFLASWIGRLPSKSVWVVAPSSAAAKLDKLQESVNVLSPYGNLVKSEQFATLAGPSGRTLSDQAWIVAHFTTESKPRPQSAESGRSPKRRRVASRGSGDSPAPTSEETGRNAAPTHDAGEVPKRKRDVDDGQGGRDQGGRARSEL
eukprot:m.107986 g.107986  ORF g.107986 m.107986 type:complete len:748 (+) comp21184_c1_seq1:1009-3252(+)